MPIERDPAYLALFVSDDVPVDETSRTFVPRLKEIGDVTYREYDGRHTLLPEVRREAIEWFLKGLTVRR